MNNESSSSRKRIVIKKRSNSTPEPQPVEASDIFVDSPSEEESTTELIDSPETPRKRVILRKRTNPVIEEEPLPDTQITETPDEEPPVEEAPTETQSPVEEAQIQEDIPQATEPTIILPQEQLAVDEPTQLVEEASEQPAEEPTQLIEDPEPEPEPVTDPEPAQPIAPAPEPNKSESKPTTVPPTVHQRNKFLLPAIICTVIIIVIALCTYWLLLSGSEHESQPLPPEPVMEIEYVEEQSFTIDGLSFLYTGETSNSLPNGDGTADYSAHNHQTWKNYTGHFTAGRWDGEGTLTLLNGDSFTGTFTRGFYSKGRYQSANGPYYEGSFRQGLPYDGTWYNPDGSLLVKISNGQNI